MLSKLKTGSNVQEEYLIQQIEDGQLTSELIESSKSTLLELRTEDESNVLHLLVTANNAPQLALFLQKAWSNYSTYDFPRKDGLTPLCLAAVNGYESILVLLLDAKANINAQNQDGATALYFAARNDNVRCVRVLLEWKAQVDLCKKDGSTALYVSSQKGNAGCVQVLLENGATVDLPTNNGHTALMAASYHHRIAAVNLLIRFHANLYHTNNEGKTALDLVRSEGCKARGKDKESLIQMLTNGVVTRKRAVAVYSVAGSGEVKEVKRLEQKAGPLPKHSKEDRHQSLYVSTVNGDTETWKLAIEPGASGGTTTKESKSAVSSSSDGYLDPKLTSQVSETSAPPKAGMLASWTKEHVIAWCHNHEEKDYREKIAAILGKYTGSTLAKTKLDNIRSALVKGGIDDDLVLDALIEAIRELRG